MRLIWSNYAKFFGEQENPGASINFVLPIVQVPFTPTVGSIFDYMGVMPGVNGAVVQTPNAVNALPLRAYMHTWNQWFRDQNQQGTQTVLMTDGPDPAINFNIMQRNKRPDYFSSALPFLQKGNAAIVPVSPTSPGAVPTWFSGSGGQVMERTDVANPTPVRLLGSSGSAGQDIGWDNPNLTVLINDLRQSVMIQEFLERDARGGTRYPELIEMHFGVENPDSRVQRVEYLGGGSTAIIVNPVTQQAPSATAPNVGNLSGVGSAFVRKHGFHKSFTEHGYLLCLVNVIGEVTYQQGLEKMWTRQTRFDFYWREFAHLGEQAVLNRELYWQATTAANAADIGVFGYNPRYEEYRFAFSRISGKFRSTDPTPLDAWHLSQEFGTLPTLSSAFISDGTSAVLKARILAVNSEPDLISDLWFDIKVARPIPVYGVPAFGRRF